MAEARSLLRATASQRDPSAAGILDRYASYHPKTGALRCSACDFAVVKHERLWSAHALSKTHRANVQAIESRERAAQQHKPHAVQDEPSETLKRKETEPEELSEAKRTRRDADTTPASLDKEWEEFQRTVLQPAASPPTPYDKATITVAPQLVREQATDEPEKEETDEERRARLEREEREDILARIDEEQRAQDEAEERYVASTHAALRHYVRASNGSKRLASGARNSLDTLRETVCICTNYTHYRQCLAGSLRSAPRATAPRPPRWRGWLPPAAHLSVRDLGRKKVLETATHQAGGI